jgi:N-acetylglutamate synthase-like GNAT family acetyltransferase
VRPTADHSAARKLAAAAGLDVSPEGTPPQALWGAYDGPRLVGVVSLDEEEGLLVVGWMAVAESERGRGLGRRLLAAAEEEARRRGASTLWATARAPGFFLARGFEPVPAGRDRGLLLAGCRDCPQNGTSCRPQAVRKALGGPSG